MTAKMSVHGRLGNDPRQVQTKTGTEMATALMFASDTAKQQKQQKSEDVENNLTL